MEDESLIYLIAVSRTAVSLILVLRYIQRERKRPCGLATGLTLIHEEGRPAAVSESSRTNADDRLPVDPLGRVEGGDGVVEGRDVADVRP